MHIKTNCLQTSLLIVVILLLPVLNGCRNVQADPKSEEPPATKIALAPDATLFGVEHP